MREPQTASTYAISDRQLGVVAQMETRQGQAIADVRALADATAELLRRLEAGHPFNGPTALEAELKVCRAAGSVARQDSFEEWAEYCGEAQ